MTRFMHYWPSVRGTTINQWIALRKRQSCGDILCECRCLNYLWCWNCTNVNTLVSLQIYIFETKNTVFYSFHPTFTCASKNAEPYSPRYDMVEFLLNTQNRYPLTHWGRVTHTSVSKLTTIGSDNGFSPGRCQAIIWTSTGILLIGASGTHLSEILNKIFIKKYIWKRRLWNGGNLSRVSVC